MKDYKNVKLIPILGTGLQRYCDDDFDAGPTNSLNVFKTEILPNIGHLFKDSTVVDAGCGNGRISALLSEHCKKVIAIDPFREPNERNKRKNIQFINTTIQDLDLDIEVDIFYLHGVFYLMDNWGGGIDAFKNMVDNLKDYGLIIIIGDPVRDSLNPPPWNPGFYSLRYLCWKWRCQVVSEFIVPSGGLRTTVIRKLPRQTNV